MKTNYTGPIEEVEVMEKVIISKEQAEAIESIKDKDYAINILALQKRPDHVLATLEISQIAKLLYGSVGYEIEPEQPKFKAGDKVLVLEDNSIFTLDERKFEHDRSEFGNAWSAKGVLGWIGENQFHLATSEEIYWLEKLNRDKVADFRKGDVIKCEDKFLQVFENMGCDIYGSHISPEFAGKLYSDGSLYALSPAESFKPFPKEDAE